MTPVVLAWSGGKDSVMALRVLRATPDVEVVSLLTTVTAKHDRVSMHGLRRDLLHAQAEALQLPVREVVLPWPCSNTEYERAMGEALGDFAAAGVRTHAFGDLFLADVRAYREAQLGRLGLEARFPLWGRDTADLAAEVVGLGYEAVLVCVDTAALDQAFAGRRYDDELLDDLPAGVDPCGENGEFHTFVSAGPGFAHRVAYLLGERVLRDGFCYQDLLPRG